MMRCRALLILVVLASLRSTDIAGQAVTQDSLRAELSRIISVRRLPAGPDSLWVALVSRRTPPELALTQFNQDNPFFLTYLLENGADFNHHLYLEAATATADPRPGFYSQLGADARFMAALHEAVTDYLAAGVPTGNRPRYATDDLIEFGSRFIRIDADSTGRVGYSLCAKSWQLRERPLPATVVFEAWMYSMLRPGIEGQALQAPMAQVRELLADTIVPSADSAMGLQRMVWTRLIQHQDFRRYLVTELDRRQRYLPFERVP